MQNVTSSFIRPFLSCSIFFLVLKKENLAKISLCPSVCMLFSKEPAPWSAAHCTLSFQESSAKRWYAMTQESKKAQRKVSYTETWILWFLCLAILIGLS